MKPSLLPHLCCPCCAGALQLAATEASADEILRGTLTCDTCHHAYAIVRGVPRLVMQPPPAIVQRNVRSFAYEWTRLAQSSPKYEEELRSYLGATSPQEFFRGQVVLEAGCGMGKFLACVSRAGASVVIGVDLSESVDVAWQLNRHHANVHIVQADLHALPFREPFDVVYSIGVLHHLPQPRAGFRAVAAHVKPDGRFFAWVYGREGNEWYIRWVDPWRRLTSRWPCRVNEWLAKGIAACLWGLIIVVYRPLAALGVRGLPLQDYFLYFHALGFRFFWGTILDKMIPTIAWYIGREELVLWLHELDLEVIELSQRNGHSWRVLSRKRLAEPVSA